MILRFICVSLSPSKVLAKNVKPSLLYNSKYIPHILNQDPGDGANGVDVMFGVIGEMDAGHQIQVFQNSIEPFPEAGVKIAQWGVGVDEQDRVVGSGVRHVRMAMERRFDHHMERSLGKDEPPFCCETKWVADVSGFADRGRDQTRQTRKSPAHNCRKT